MIYLNNKPLSVTIFPDGTSQVWQLPQEQLEFKAWVNIRWEYSHEGEIVHLAQLKQLLDEHDINCGLWIEYLPYGRQDKYVSNHSTFALQTFAKILNSLEFEHIWIVDPHSDVATFLIKNSIATYPTERVNKVFKDTNSHVICYPDNGALIKYRTIYDKPFINGHKVRNQLTGNIESYALMGDCRDQTVLIVDDIADGGATFKLLAKSLLAAGAKEVSLFVTHGIFSKGTKDLFDSGIKRIFTKNEEIK